jgi:lipopolysaccharide transport system ATP-binding protein
MKGHNTAIKAQDISKVYRLGEIGTGTVSRDLERWFARMRGKEDPFLKIGETNDRTVKGDSDVVYSLRNINFEIEQGDAVGVIGRNGAGKSTLLKILSRVTTPTTGKIKVKGRVASLLEVGTGFHPELTGRENIYLNGAILGMRKKEITRKLDQIIDFSGVERYIDTPVKRYSSGMYVRLAFAVAAHLESEILVVDEVLAVGDVDFQKKCLGKMNDVSKGEGRTVLFVSHNMQAINTLCRSVLLLQNGETAFFGNVKEGMNLYLSNQNHVINSQMMQELLLQTASDEVFELVDFSITQKGSDGDEFVSSAPIKIQFDYKIKKEVAGLRVGFDLLEKTSEIILFRSFHDDDAESIETKQPGTYNAQVEIPANFLKQGSYLINLAIGIHNVRWIVFDTAKIQLNINNISGVNKLYADERPGIIMPGVHWVNNQLV